MAQALSAASLPHTGDVHAVIKWFQHNGRDLPWRDPVTTPWGVLVSEVMLQQTPASRVEPVWRRWMQLWPTSADLSAASSARVLSEWGHLGYPRRALRLHEAAAYIETHHRSQVPHTTEELRAIPGVGEYTAAAIQSFAFHEPSVVLDVNIRRVLTRVYLGRNLTGAATTKEERELGATALTAARGDPQWNAAIMEFGALVCTSRSPQCGSCPIAANCCWRAAGYPESAVKRRAQAWEGTDRQIRGRIMRTLREAPLHHAAETDLLAMWHDEAQAHRALSTLAEDGLIHQASPGVYGLGTG